MKPLSICVCLVAATLSTSTAAQTTAEEAAAPPPSAPASVADAGVVDAGAPIPQLELAAPVRPCDARDRVRRLLQAEPVADVIASILSELPLEPTDKQDQGCAAFQLGIGALRLGDGVAAKSQFDLASRRLGPLRDGLRLWRFQADLLVDAPRALKQAKATKRRLRRLPLTQNQLLLVEAEAVRKHGAPKDILRVERALLKAKVGDEATSLLSIAKAFVALENERAAHASYRKLLIEHPGHPLAREHEPLLDEELRLSPKEQAQRIENLIKVSRMQRAYDEAKGYPRVGLSRDPERVPLEVATVKAMVRADDSDGAVAHAARLLERANPDFEWRRIYAWALGKARRYDDAKAAWADVHKAATTPSQKADACFFAGFTSYEIDDATSAIATWTRCEADLKGTDFGALALWYRGLLQYSADQKTEAVTTWTRLMQEHPAHPESTKHTYWMGRALDETGDATQAQKHWAQLLARHPTTYYGLLAARRLDLPPVGGASVDADALSAKVRDTRATKAVMLAYNLGLDDLARDLVSKVRKADRYGMLQRIDAHHEVWRRGALGIPRPPVRGRQLAAAASWRMSYAKPHLALVEKSAETHSIDASFAYAIMRTESGFLPTAKSHAGALGLLQLMPYTAIGMAKALQQDPPDVDTLVEPAVNIPLGVAFLGTSLKEFGSMLLAAACYNGAPQNVVEWQVRFQAMEPELFVERIPFKETRNYVKKVLQTEAMYRSLDGDPLDLDLPEGVMGPPPKTYTSFASTDDGG